MLSLFRVCLCAFSLTLFELILWWWGSWPFIPHIKRRASFSWPTGKILQGWILMIFGNCPPVLKGMSTLTDSKILVLDFPWVLSHQQQTIVYLLYADHSASHVKWRKGYEYSRKFFPALEFWDCIITDVLGINSGRKYFGRIMKSDFLFPCGWLSQYRTIKVKGVMSGISEAISQVTQRSTV